MDVLTILRRALPLRPRRHAAADLIDGAIAGAIATWVMGKVTGHFYEHEKPAARKREDEARRGRASYEVAADKTAAWIGSTLSPRRREQAGAAIHWTIGIGAGALYAVLRPRLAPLSAAGGLPFGAVFWLLVDEFGVAVLRLTPGPRAFPWQTHARGLAGHLTFGAVTDAVLRIVQRIR